MAKRKKTVRKRQRPEPKADTVQAMDGEISVEVRGGKFDGQTIVMDITLVKLACEELERKHNLPIEDGKLQATTAFAKDLAAEIEGLGFNCTPAIAINAWVAVNAHFAELQKKTQ